MISGFVAFSLCVSLLLHPLHVSVTSIEFNEDMQFFDISFKVFSDDFEDMIRMKYGIDITGSPDSVEVVERYFNESFRFVFSHEEHGSWQYNGSRSNQESIWFAFRCEPPGKIHRITIVNHIMLDMYADQTNLVIFKYGDFDRGFKFDYRNTKKTIEF